MGTLALVVAGAQFADPTGRAGIGAGGASGELLYVDRVADGDYDGRGEPVEIRGVGGFAVHDQGQALYLASELGLQVFRRDARSGRLDRVRTLAGDVDLSRAAVAWDAARSRLLADDCGTWRAFPLARGTELPDGTELADSTELIVEDDPYTCGHDLLVGADGGSFHRVGQGRVDVFASGAKGALRFAQTLEAGGLSQAALHPGGSHLYALADGGLLVFQRNTETGLFALAEARTVLTGPATALAVATDGTHMSAVDGSGLGVFDLSDPALPRRVAAANLPAAVGVGGCRFAQAVPGAAAVDVFCPGAVLGAGWRTGGGALETWSIVPENGDLAHPRDAMPPFGAPTAVAASPDGRHVYVATPAAGVLIFARGGGERAAVPRDAARPEAVRGRGRYSAQDESGPDFLITEIQAVRTSFSGQQFKLKVTVHNQADVATQDPTLSYYRSADASRVPADDTVVDSKTFDRGHGASIVWSNALEPESGAYYYACVDAVAGELRTNNNCSSEAVFVAGDAPDLVVASATVSDARPSPGGTFDLNATVSNVGEGRSPSAYLIHYRSDDAGVGPDDEELGRFEVEPLDALGASSARTIAVTAPSSPGTRYYGACVSAWTDVESDTTNNCSAGVPVDVGADAPEPASPIDLGDIGEAYGIAHYGGRLYVVDNDADRVLAYDPSGARVAAAGFDLQDGNANTNGMAYAGGRFHLLDSFDDKVYAYRVDGARAPDHDFDLDAGNLVASGIVHAPGGFRVVDYDAKKVYGYGSDGSRDAALDFALAEGAPTEPTGTAYADGRLYVLGDGKVFAYRPDGGRAPESDFDLDRENGDASGIAYAGWFYVLDRDGRKVYVYPGPDSAPTGGRGDVAFSDPLVISTNAEGAADVHAADLDGDGDMDVLSASSHDDKIAWYRNDGTGGFSAQTVISTDAVGALSVHAADLDGDGDLDVLSASEYDDRIAWYRNDGTSGFSAQPVISANAVGAADVHAADLDGDGDMDVLSASASDNRIAWYRNDGTSGFSAQPVISTDAVGALSVHAADLDGDGDMDVLSASVFDNRIAWYRNDREDGFSAQPAISINADGAADVHAADLDGDGDMDVLSASRGDDKIAWYRNDGPSGFSAQPVISTDAVGAWDVHAADLDGDGDMDVLSASVFDNRIAWYRNDGPSGFSAQPVISTDADGASSVHAADLDGDGDMDVLSASFYDNKIAWYENVRSH